MVVICEIGCFGRVNIFRMQCPNCQIHFENKMKKKKYRIVCRNSFKTTVHTFWNNLKHYYSEWMKQFIMATTELLKRWLKFKFPAPRLSNFTDKNSSTLRILSIILEKKLYKERFNTMAKEKGQIDKQRTTKHYIGYFSNHGQTV